jgi:hypothetical protein
MTTETGGPAFPGFDYIDQGGKKNPEGMTLRDYFAAKAMQGLLSNPKLQKEILAQGGCKSGWIESSAWAFADAMLKARKE